MLSFYVLTTVRSNDCSANENAWPFITVKLAGIWLFMFKNVLTVVKGAENRWCSRFYISG